MKKITKISTKANNAPLIQSLIAIDFTEKEAAVYIALLEISRGTASEIARKAGINRTTGYTILDTLVSRGLVSISGKEPKQEYIAESPEKIKALLEEKIQRYQEHAKRADDLIPQLKSIHTVSDKPKVRFFEGTQGLMDVYEDTLTSHETIRAYATVDDMHHALPRYFPRYYKRRAGKGINIRAIIPSTPIGRERASLDEAEARETALIPADQFYFTPEINIYDNKVMIASWREKLGIIIESAEIADVMKKTFELAWAEAKRLDKTCAQSGEKV